MPLVFVHGVATRDGEPYRAGRSAKRDFFERHLSGAMIGGRAINPVCLSDDEVSFPYWGHLGASFRWDMASLPPPKEEALGGLSKDDHALQAALATWADLAPETMGEYDSLMRLLEARSFQDAVVVLNEAIIQTASDPDAAGAFVVAASAYAAANPDPDWLKGEMTDATFVDRLISRVTPHPEGDRESLGPWSNVGNMVHKASARLKKAALDVAKGGASHLGKLVSPYAVARWRYRVNDVIGRFTGDAFRYFDGRGELGRMGPILSIVASALLGASRQSEPLVVVGHSLGGVITFDLLSYFRSDIVVDLFVTVGSQVSHFEEMTLFRSSNPKIPANGIARAPRPPNIQRWINVYDPVDVLSYACGDVFEGVSDFSFESNTNTLHAHSAYFEQNAFYERLRQRIDG